MYTVVAGGVEDRSPVGSEVVDVWEVCRSELLLYISRGSALFPILDHSRSCHQSCLQAGSVSLAQDQHQGFLNCLNGNSKTEHQHGGIRGCRSSCSPSDDGDFESLIDGVDLNYKLTETPLGQCITLFVLGKKSPYSFKRLIKPCVH